MWSLSMDIYLLKKENYSDMLGIAWNKKNIIELLWNDMYIWSSSEQGIIYD